MTGLKCINWVSHCSENSCYGNPDRDGTAVKESCPESKCYWLNEIFFFFLVWWGLVLEVVRMGVEAGEPTLMTIWTVWFFFFFFLVTQSCPTLWDSMNYRLAVSSVHGIFQARILEWVAIPFCKGSSWPRDRTWVSWIGRWIFYQLSHQGSPMVCLHIDRSCQESSEKQEVKWSSAWVTVSGAELLDFNVA